jgi:hypothetical protein
MGNINRYVSHKFDEVGALISGPLEKHLSSCGVQANLSEEDILKYAPDERLRAKRAGMYLYKDIDLYARDLGVSVIDLLRVGSGLDPDYLSSGNPTETNRERYEAVKSFYRFLKQASTSQKEYCSSILAILAYHRPWIQLSLSDISPYNRFQAFYRHTIQVKNYMRSSDRNPDTYHGPGILETCDILERLMSGIPAIGNASSDYAMLCTMYHLSFHWAFAQKLDVSVYGFPDPGDETLFSVFTLLGTSEQSILASAVGFAGRRCLK